MGSFTEPRVVTDQFAISGRRPPGDERGLAGHDDRRGRTPNVPDVPAAQVLDRLRVHVRLARPLRLAPHVDAQLRFADCERATAVYLTQETIIEFIDYVIRVEIHAANLESTSFSLPWR